MSDGVKKELRHLIELFCYRRQDAIDQVVEKYGQPERRTMLLSHLDEILVELSAEEARAKKYAGNSGMAMEIHDNFRHAVWLTKDMIALFKDT